MQNRNTFPDVSGAWAMEIHWTRGETSGCLQAEAFVRQDGSALSMTVRSVGSDSHTMLVQPGRDLLGDPVLYYMYEVEPRATHTDATGPYKGAAILRYYPHGQELSGNYWTSQRSAGHFKLTRNLDAADKAMNDTTDVLLITAIKEEYEAAKQVFSAISLEGEGVREWKDVEAATASPYQRGMFYRDGKPLFSLILAKPPRMGGIHTGQIAAVLADRLKPACLVMCGVCAGNPNELALGDIVISEFAYQYDEGKLGKDGFLGDHRQLPVSTLWHQAAEILRPEVLPSFGQPSSRDARYWLLERLYAGDDPRRHPARSRYFPKSEWKVLAQALEAEGVIERQGTSFKLTDGGRDEVERSIAFDVDPPEQLPIAIMVGPIASGNVVVKDGVTWDSLKAMGVRNVLGLRWRRRRSASRPAAQPFHSGSSSKESWTTPIPERTIASSLLPRAPQLRRSVPFSWAAIWRIRPHRRQSSPDLAAPCGETGYCRFASPWELMFANLASLIGLPLSVGHPAAMGPHAGHS